MQEPKYEFKDINDDVNALAWLPSSQNDILVATEDNLKICDIRSTWTIKKFIEEVSFKNESVYSIKFDPFDNNRFAAQCFKTIKIFDLRNRKRPLFELKDETYFRRIDGFEWC